jgi:hypothetical protein
MFGQDTFSFTSLIQQILDRIVGLPFILVHRVLPSFMVLFQRQPDLFEELSSLIDRALKIPEEVQVRVWEKSIFPKYSSALSELNTLCAVCLTIQRQLVTLFPRHGQSEEEDSSPTNSVYSDVLQVPS